MRGFLFIAFTCCLLCCLSSPAQRIESLSPADTVPDLKLNVNPKYQSRYDSATKAHSPRKAAIRSAILPGLGQIYNKKYWKLPIVYGAIGTTAGIFIYNINWYKRTRFAYRVLVEKDSASFPLVHQKLQFLVQRDNQSGLQYLRDSYRRDVDYSVLFFLLAWGLNVVDASVDAHLKSFDVSPDLSLRIKPGYSEMANTNGLSLVLQIGK